MRPDARAFDDEIRGHIAISIQERIERGEDPEASRLAAMKEFGNLLLTQESMREVWRPRWVESALAFLQDVRVAMRSLRHAKGLAATVALMLALGIGANAAVFSVVRQVLFRPLVNREADRIVYVRQSAAGLGAANTTFSMAEIRDLRAASTKVAAFGDFSTIDFTMVGFGEPRVVKAGVVSGSYFEVMGLRPVLGRLIGPADDGPRAAPVAVLTHRFWSTSLNRDATVIGKTVRLGSRNATVIGVLEPSLPYPADTELVANVVTSPHHLGATMVSQRTHRMTELFGRLSPGATIESARAELEAAHAVMLRQYPEAYPKSARTSLSVTPFRDQVTAPARTVLLMLLAAAGVVFAIACSNVANLILARTVRRESELAVRAALGAGRAALRRMLLAESLVLCGTGAFLGVLLAQPLVGVVSRFAARFSVRALDVAVDPSLLWVGTGLALVAAVALAFVPRLPSAHAPTGSVAAVAGLRITPGTGRRLRAFAVAQIALSFVLLCGAGMLLASLVALQTAQDRLRHAPGAGRRRPAADRGLRPKGARLLRGGDAPHRSAARGPARGDRQLRPVARRRADGPGLPLHGRGIRQGGGRRGPAWPAAHRLAGFLRGARRTARRRARLHRGRPRRPRARRRRERERGAAARSRTATRSTTACGGPIRTSASRSRAGSWASSRTWTTRTWCRGRRSRSTTRCGSFPTADASSCTRRAIPTRS